VDSYVAAFATALDGALDRAESARLIAAAADRLG
jgi:hypothetical protein